jgi:hypothetical protein
MHSTNKHLEMHRNNDIRHRTEISFDMMTGMITTNITLGMQSDNTARNQTEHVWLIPSSKNVS